MLFNTLAYAKFFAFVFIAAWLLVRRDLAIWLPWLAVCACTAFGRKHQLDIATGTEWLVVAVFALATWFLARKSSPDAAAPKASVLACSLVSVVALIWLLRHQGHAGFVLATLSGIGVEQETIEALSRLDAWKTWVMDALAGSAALVGSYALIRARRVRLLFVLGASYVFYAHWDWRFLPLIFGSSSVDYLLGLKIGATSDPKRRKQWLWLTVVVNLGVLCIFKYLGFGVETALTTLRALGFDPSPTVVSIALPVGISFFTFESMSYVIDVYRGHLAPHRSYLEYLSFVAFFPHLVAGPIVRPGDLLPQLAKSARFDPRLGSEGLFLIAWGLLKKVGIGDALGVNLVDRVFDAPMQFSALECYAAVIGYAIQIYCDFSGYTDIAIGSALLLGIRFPLNFNAPYKAVDIQDFWRRWHISLSTWLRDYLYIPLGGSRRSKVRVYFNLMVTMLLGGLWHGASFNFVIWGGLHGVALALHRLLSPWLSPFRKGPLRVVSVVATFHFVCVAWIFFRSETLGGARVMFSQLAQLTTFHPNLHPTVLLLLAVGLSTHFAPEKWYRAVKDNFVRAPALAQGLTLLIAAVVLQRVMTSEAVPFVYFQF